MQLDKVGKLVKAMMLSYPTLYRNRFEAMAEIMSNSCYGWDEGGNIIQTVGEPFSGTPVSMVVHFVEEQSKQLSEANEDDKKGGHLRDLHKERVVAAGEELLVAQFKAKNIDVYAGSYCGVTYRDHWRWLWDAHRHGVPIHGCITCPPANISEEWRLAIREWLSEMMPAMNSIMGTCDPVDLSKPWEPIRGYEKIFNWVHATYKAYETEADRIASVQQARIAEEIVNAIQAESNAYDQLMATGSPEEIAAAIQSAQAKGRDRNRRRT